MHGKCGSCPRRSPLRHAKSQSLRIKEILGSQVSVDVALDDSDLPRLHSLSFSGFFFTRAIAVRSLKSITINMVPRSCYIFLTALERCALGLELLMLNMWVHIL